MEEKIDLNNISPEDVKLLPPEYRAKLKDILLRQEMQQAFQQSGAPPVPMPKVDVKPVPENPFNPENPRNQLFMRLAGGAAGVASGGGSLPLSLGLGALGAATTKTPGDLLSSLIPGVGKYIPGLTKSPFVKGAIGGVADVGINKLIHMLTGEKNPPSTASNVAAPLLGGLIGGVANKYGQMSGDWANMLKKAEGGKKLEEKIIKTENLVNKLQQDASTGKAVENTQKNEVKTLLLDLKEAAKNKQTNVADIANEVEIAKRELINLNQGNVDNTSVLERYQIDLAKNKKDIDKTMNELKIPADHPLRQSITPSMVWMLSKIVPTLSPGIAVAAVIARLGTETHDPNTFNKLAAFYAKKKVSSEQLSKINKAIPFLVNAEKNLELNNSGSPQ